MATRRTSRPSARWQTTRTGSARSLYRRPLRFEPLEDRRLLALVTVTTLEDSVDLNDGLTSLREAIFATNAAPGADTIDFDPALIAAGPVTIRLTKGELIITDSLAINGPGAELLTIDASGSDPTPTIKDARGTRIYSMAGPSVVTLRGQTLTGGDASLRGGAIMNKGARLTIQESVVTGSATSEFGGGVYSSTEVVIESTTISNNTATGRSGIGVGGGGVFVRGANLTIRNSLITGNQAIQGGGISFNDFYSPSTEQFSITDCTISNNNAFDSGGGIWARMTNGSVSLANSVVEKNKAGLLPPGIGAGGGMYLNLTRATAIISGVQVRDNSALTGGGGYFRIANGELSISDSQVVDNHAFGLQGTGGGLSVLGNVSATATIRNSSIHNNTASFVTGGGIYSTGATLVVEASTVSVNSAGKNGGGIHHSNGPLTILHSTVVGNFVAFNGVGAGVQHAAANSVPTTIEHSIIAGNYVLSSAPSDLLRTAAPGASTVRYNLIGHNAGSGLVETGPGTPDANGNLVGGNVRGVIDPRLAPLANNGGPTKTHALLPGSPAINAGNLNAQAGVGGVPLYDQRGEPFSRVFGGRIDIGAFERQELSDLNLLVDTLVDESDGNYSRGDLSLREAIELANLWQSTDTIRFDPTLTAAGPATILLTKGELRITDDVAIIGPGANLLTIDASGNDPTPGINDGKGSRIFSIGTSVNNDLEVTISRLLLTGGDTDRGGAIFNSAKLTISESTLTHNHASITGGAVSSSRQLKLVDCHIANNVSRFSAGGIYAQRELEIFSSTIINNTAGGNGGGINTFGADVILTNVFFAGNSASGSGGGMYFSVSSSNSLVLVESTITGNTASQSGGGLYLDRGFGYGHVSISACTIADNSAAMNGGGISTAQTTEVHNSTIAGNITGLNGGGIFAPRSEFLTSPKLTIQNSTISSNTADNGGGILAHVPISMISSTISSNKARNAGGGVWAERGYRDPRGEIRFSTIANNTSNIGGGLFLAQGNLLIDHCIVAANQGVFGPDLTGLIGATFNAHFNLIEQGMMSGLTYAPKGRPDSNGNIVGMGDIAIRPLLGPLTNNGGPTMTHALLPGSPAINTGDPNAAPGVVGVSLYDQRGEPFKRVYGGRIDIGAVESQPNPLPGDYNFDGLVSSADFVVWQQTLGSTTDLRADGNGDGRVNEPDRAVWMANFGSIRLLVPAVTHETAEPSEIARRPVGTFDPSPAIVRRTTPTRVPARPVVTPATTAAVIRDKALEDSITAREKTAPRERVALRLALAALDQAFESPGIV